MRPMIPACALIALLAAAPAAAQSSGSTGSNPGQALGTGKAQTVQPRGSALNAANITINKLDQDETQSLNRLAQDSVAALQTANLATDKHTPKTVELLGDHVSLTASQLNNDITAIERASKAEFADRMPDEAVKAMDEMADLNEKKFADRYVAYVRDVHPRLIRELEQLSQRSDEQVLKSMAETYLPPLRDQLAAAQQLASGGYDNEQLAQKLDRGLDIVRKDAAGIPPPGPATGDRPASAPKNETK